MKNRNTVLLNAVVATGASASASVLELTDHTFFILAAGVTTGATILLEASPDGSNWYLVQSVAVAVTGNTTQRIQGAFPFLRANISARTDGTYTVTLFSKKEVR